MTTGPNFGPHFFCKSLAKDHMTPLRIGIDGRMLGPSPSGIGRYIIEMCRALDRVLSSAEFFLYLRRPAEPPVASPRWHIRLDKSAASRRLPSSFWLALWAGQFASYDDLDVFWGTTGLLPLVRAPRRAVVTVHDLVHRIAPHTMSRRSLWNARLFFKSSLNKADAIVPVSQGVARGLEEMFGYRAAAVVYPGLSAAFRPATEIEIARVTKHYRLSNPYLLNVATFAPLKNLPVLIRSFVALKQEGLIGLRELVLAAGAGWKDGEIKAELARAGESVTWLGYVPHMDLPALYSGADAFVFPSLYESFGMPVLEARACGTRVITSDVPGLREAGGEETIYVPPTCDGIRAGILEALAMPPAQPIDAGQYSWDRSAASLADVLVRAASGERQIRGNTSPRSTP